jgi:UDP-N-acetylmuramate dehydrogenase
MELPVVRGKYRYNAELSKLCWFGVGGKAEVLFIPEDLDDLCNFLQKKSPNIKVNIIGIGSNIIPSDAGIEGVTIRLGRSFNFVEDMGNHLLRVGAATLDVNFASAAADMNVAGLEFFAGIPGTIGGAIAMNAGAYGGDTSCCLVSAKAVELSSGLVRELVNSEFGFDYRSNNLPKNWLFVEAVFQGKAGNKNKIEQQIMQIQQQRAATQPVRTRTGGSTFKNPNGYKAWELIDKAGCRGLRVGGAEVSHMHCNFFISDGTATAKDLIQLIAEVKHRVLEHSGIQLEEEIKILS